MSNTVTPQILISDEFSKQLMDLVTNKAISVLEEFDVHGKRSLQLSLQLGELISTAKGISPHGGFTSWHEKTLKLGASQCSVHHRLYKARADIDGAREWAKRTGHPHRDSDSPERVLRLISEWKKDAAQDSCGKETKKTGTKDYADKVQAILQTDEVKASRETMPRAIPVTIERAAATIFAHRSSSGADLLDRSQEYLAFLVKLLTDQTCGTPHLCIPPEDEVIAA